MSYRFLGLVQSNHGSSAALYDGQRMLACCEERFDRIKFSAGFPHQAMRWCLEATGATVNDLDGVGFYMTGSNYLRSARSSQIGPWRYYPEALYGIAANVLRYVSEKEEICSIVQKVDFFGAGGIDLHFIDHHTAHAGGSFLMSGLDSAAVLCLDGNGDGCCLSFARGCGKKIEFLYRQPFPHSLGQFYSTFTQLLGFNPNSDEYKVMGCAAYGNAERYYEPVRRCLRLEAGGGFTLDMDCFAFNMTTSTAKYTQALLDAIGLEPNEDTETVAPEYCDLAASVQAVTEEALFHILTGLKERSGQENLCYGGGVALNCLANGRVLPQMGWKRVFIPPNPGDGGLSAGVCSYLAHSVHGHPREYAYRHDHLGPEFSADEIRKCLQENGLRWEEPSDMAVAMAQHLAAGKILARFDGPSEFGPRALGNRSVLADPRKAETKEVLNRKIKFREPFRPFAPACLAGRAGELFSVAEEDGCEAALTDFMLQTAEVHPAWRERLAAACHADNTARLQTVRSSVSPGFYAAIKAFAAETGVPALVNTSFNVKGEPIVLAPRDALRCLYSTGLDALVLGPFLVEKD